MPRSRSSLIVAILVGLILTWVGGVTLVTTSPNCSTHHLSVTPDYSTPPDETVQFSSLSASEQHAFETALPDHRGQGMAAIDEPRFTSPTYVTYEEQTYFVTLESNTGCNGVGHMFVRLSPLVSGVVLLIAGGLASLRQWNRSE